MDKINVEFTRDELQKILEYFCGLNGVANKSINEKLITAIQQLDIPQIGDRCAFWDDDKEKYSIGFLTDITIKNEHKYEFSNRYYYKHCAKIKKEAEF